MKHPPATRNDHEKFCTTGEWERRKTATGKTGTRQVNYELVIFDGRILYTWIGHPVDRTDYGPSRWGRIPRDQLVVANDAIWDCVHNRILPDRGALAAAPENAIPAEIVAILVRKFHVPEDEVKAKTANGAIARMGELFTKPPTE